MSGDAGPDSRVFIAALDVGTTNVRCLIINSNGLIVGKAHQKVILLTFQDEFDILLVNILGEVV